MLLSSIENRGAVESAHNTGLMIWTFFCDACDQCLKILFAQYASWVGPRSDEHRDHRAHQWCSRLERARLIASDEFRVPWNHSPL